MIIGALFALALGALWMIIATPFWAFVFGTIGTAIAFACAFVWSFLI